MTGQLLAAAGDMSTGESTVFVVLGIAAVVGAVGMVLARNAVHSALFLVLTMLSLGVFYFVQQAPFLGVVQIIVYTGAIMILFLFVLMLIGRDSVDSMVETLPGQRTAAVVLGLAFAGLVGATVYRGVRDITPRGIPDVNNSVPVIAAALFHDYVFAFELTSALLITAAVGAMVLAHVERPAGTRQTQRDLARARFRGGRPQPLPGPGVFATSNSIGTPALLPDGTVARESISRLVEPNLAVVAARAELTSGGAGHDTGERSGVGDES
ncbi:MAG: NADH-quinone oxidoreductase subunit J [Actinobacteria bacterium]|nr:NADH-quinone oxidoreductase subunit J [Actinomycetota bacterium]MBI3686850.1 NADH-quinone oxidoreductase subunit J [Actinomycetota bacterium]